MRRAALLPLLLAACSGTGAPSEANIREALTAASNRGAPAAVKLACKQSPERPGYICDYRAPACNRYTGACGAAKPFTGRFLHAAGRWQLVEDLTPRAQPDPVTQPLPGVGASTPGAPPTLAPVPTPVYELGDPVPPTGLPTPAPQTPNAPAPVPTIAPPPPPGGYGEPLRTKDQRRVSEWIGLNARCRAGRGEYRWDACRDRDRLSRKLERRGLCNTAQGWSRC